MLDGGTRKELEVSSLLIEGVLGGGGEVDGVLEVKAPLDVDV